MASIIGQKRPKPLRHPGAGLAAVITLALLAAFFAWQGAEPFWLAVGRGEAGIAIVTRCDVTDGVPVATEAAGNAVTTYRCVVFEAADGGFRAVGVTLFGAGEAARAEGSRLPARMLGPDHGQAYAVGKAGLHLRWGLGLALVLACGAGIAWTSGATRLDRARARRLATAVSLAGPLVLAAGFLVEAF